MDKPVEPFELHVVIESPDENPVDVLQRESRLSRQKIKTALTKGAVWMSRRGSTRRLRRATRKLRVGDELHLYYSAKVLDEKPEAPILVADVGGYSVWNKPYGLRSQGSKWGDHCTVTRWAETHLLPERPAFVVHRLDRAANGLILVAHSKTIAAALSKLFRERTIEKRYRVIVAGDFSGRPVPLRVDTPIDEKSAVSEFSYRRGEHDRSELDVRMETGRKHQIRRHLAELGFPVVGDRLYNEDASDGVDLQLTAYLLAFRCPVTDEPVEYRLAQSPDTLPDGSRGAVSRN